jgi:hypothetical protein
MRLMAIAIVAGFAMGAVSGANAEPVKKRVVYQQSGYQQSGYQQPGSTTIISRDEQGRTRTKVLVQKRSYLDGGTEVMPGDIQGQQTNFIGMNQMPTSIISNDSIVPARPITDPFFLPGKDNPYFR